MEFTGERVIPGQVELDLWNEHLARYALAAWLAGRSHAGTGALRRKPKAGHPAGVLRVLDAGCGSGYGASLLASVGPQVTVLGVDNSAEAIDYATSHYAAPNLRFLLADCLSLPPDLGEFDLVVAFEVIEHLADPEPFLRAVGSLLAPSGILVVSTPNRHYYTEERNYTNPFHAREYDPAEFEALLKRFFSEPRIFTENHAAAIAFHPVGASGAEPASCFEGAARVSGPPDSTDQPHFLLGICGHGVLPDLGPFVFVPSAANVLRERERHIARLEQDLAALQEETRLELDERKRWAEKLEAGIAERDAAIRELQAAHEQANQWARELDKMLEEARAAIQARDRELEERAAWVKQVEQECARLSEMVRGLQADLESKVNWARSLEAELERKVNWARSLEADLGRAREALDALNREFEERTAWALSLDQELKAEREKVARLVADLDLLLGSFWYRAGKKLRLSPVPGCDVKREAK
jgi:SAM-dependent methyltransferase